MKRSFDQISQEVDAYGDADTQPMDDMEGISQGQQQQNLSDQGRKKEIEELDTFIKQLVNSKNSIEIKAILPVLITYLTPTSNNFIPNALSYINSSNYLLEHLVTVFTYVLNELNIELSSIYDRDTIVLFVRFSTVMVCSNISNNDVVKFMSRINYWSNLVSVGIGFILKLFSYHMILTKLKNKYLMD